MMLEVRPPPAPDLPQLPTSPSLHAVLSTPADRTGALRPARFARPPKGGLLFRGSGPASYPTKPLGSYHVSPTTTWMDPPSTGDVRRWGALLTAGWAEMFGSPK